MSRIPSEFTAGDTVSWIDATVPPDADAATVYLRGNYAQGVSASGSLTADGWRFTIQGSVTAGLTPSPNWSAQTVAVVDGESRATATLRVEIKPSLAFTGNAAAVDLRTQARKDLDAAEEAIRALVAGAQEYKIGFGNQGRTVRRADLSELIAWRDRLKAEVATEERAASGRVDRGIYVRFTPWD